VENAGKLNGKVVVWLIEQDREYVPGPGNDPLGRRGWHSPRETGLKALGSMAKPDPFLVPGKEFFILARLEARHSSEDQTDPIPILAIIAYFYSPTEPPIVEE
jgi:hypothetical protein